MVLAGWRVAHPFDAYRTQLTEFGCAPFSPLARGWVSVRGRHGRDRIGVDGAAERADGTLEMVGWATRRKNESGHELRSCRLQVIASAAGQDG